MKNNNFLSQKGISVTETMIAMPIILLLGLGTVEMGYMWQAKSTLDYAAFMAAREGAMDGLDPAKMRCAALKAMDATRIHPPGAPRSEYESECLDTSVISQNLILYVANPTYEAFQDFGLLSGSSCVGKKPTNCEIPNSSLSYRSTAVGATSKINIQDANNVRVQIVYGYDPITPFIRDILLSESFECVLFKVGCDLNSKGSATAGLTKGAFTHPFINKGQEKKHEKRVPLLGYGTVRAESNLKARDELLRENKFISYGQILSRCQVENLVLGNGIGGIPPDMESAKNYCPY